MVLRSLPAAALVLIATVAAAEEPAGSARARLEAAAASSLGGPASAPAQLEEDRLRRLEESRWPALDRFLDPVEAARDGLRESTGLSLSADYQTMFQQATDGLGGPESAAAGQARLIGKWTLLDRGGSNPGNLVFILENRHRLGTDIAPADLAGEVGYAGLTATTFGATNNSLSVAYWSQTLFDGRGGAVAGRIDPGDYTDILGYVNPRTTFSNFSILYNPVLPIPDPGFGLGGGAFLTDEFYVLAVIADANGSLTDIDWFPGGDEIYSYGEIGWSPGKDQRYLTNLHLGVFHVDARDDAGVPESHGLVLSGNHTFGDELMIYGRLGWSEGGAPIARLAAGGGLMWRPGHYDDLFGIGFTVADPSDSGLDTQTSVEAFYRFDLSDNLAITADLQYLNNPGSNDRNPLILGLRARFNL